MANPPMIVPNSARCAGSQRVHARLARIVASRRITAGGTFRRWMHMHLLAAGDCRSAGKSPAARLRSLGAGL
jgi:hypothetical protein